MVKPSSVPEAVSREAASLFSCAGAYAPAVDDGDRLERFVRGHTVVCPVPLVPELVLHQATELTPLWHATARELEGWDPSPYWAFPWAGGQALARHLLDHPALVLGLRVFDLATGSGLVAIAAARAGAARVVAADVDPLCETVVRLNCALNGVAVEFLHGDPLGEPLRGFEVVLAGDVFYERPLAGRALAWLRAAAAGGARVLVGDPGRTYSPAGLAERAVHDVPTTPEIEAGDRLRTRVLEILPG
jgi:predicted nicotinamide N-methyase